MMSNKDMKEYSEFDKEMDSSINEPQDTYRNNHDDTNDDNNGSMFVRNVQTSTSNTNQMARISRGATTHSGNNNTGMSKFDNNGFMKVKIDHDASLQVKKKGAVPFMS